MKFCPTCETRYDEEILRFCTKDGTPLVDENQPNFVEMPSESLETPEDDPSEETMVRYKPPKDIIEPAPPPEIDRSEAPRIVISTTEQKKEQNVRSRNIPPYQGVPPKSNTGKVVALTIFGTLTLLAFGLGLFWLLRDEAAPSNKNQLNVNTNPPDTNISNSINLGGINVPSTTNSRVNSNFNFNLATNTNANPKTPTPTPKPSPSPSANANINANLGNINIIGTPTPKPAATITPTPNATPKVSPTPDRTGRPPNNTGEEH